MKSFMTLALLACLAGSSVAKPAPVHGSVVDHHSFAKRLSLFLAPRKSLDPDWVMETKRDSDEEDDDTLQKAKRDGEEEDDDALHKAKRDDEEEDDDTQQFKRHDEADGDNDGDNGDDNDDDSKDDEDDDSHVSSQKFKREEEQYADIQERDGDVADPTLESLDDNTHF